MSRVMNKEQVWSQLPSEWAQDPLPDVRTALAATHQKIVVLDDDPTGTQTVYDTPVLTRWDVKTLCAEFERPNSLVYLLTNSRSLPQAQTIALHTEIGQALGHAVQQTGRRMTVISRSDSTLRGHYPAEVDALAAALDADFDATLIIPAFIEGGRYTIDDVHYVAEDDHLIPAAATPFARDAAFGYRESNLRAWVEEKTSGHINANDVASISLQTIRTGGVDAVAMQLMTLSKNSVCIVNAASRRDLEVIALGTIQAEMRGKRLLYRTAATFVAARAGLDSRPLLTATALNLSEHGGGLVIVGSYVPKTTTQLHHLLSHTGIHRVEIQVERLLDDSTQPQEIDKAINTVETLLQSGQDVAVYTSRKLITGNDEDSSLHIGQRISDSLVHIMQHIKTPPRYVLAKGGITSSDIATNGLNVTRATVLGQILPGIPVWQLGDESRFPAMPYIVFPGNVGGEDAVTTVVQQLLSGGGG